MKIEREWRVTNEGVRALELLADVSEISKGKFKDAMAKGAVQVLRKRKTIRVRRATAVLQAGDCLQLHYDDNLLQRVPAAPVLIQDNLRYSVWYKPAGVLAQGNEWGDHCALLRLVELHYANERQVYLIHRLDREARGLMMVAHDADASAKLSALFSSREMEKTYRVKVLGQLPEKDEFNETLDGKTALTHFTREHYDAVTNISTALVKIDSGRKHQIRRHFANAGFPVMGDPVYGTTASGNAHACADGLQLCAIRLKYFCPLRKHEKTIEFDDDLINAKI